MSLWKTKIFSPKYHRSIDPFDSRHRFSFEVSAEINTNESTIVFLKFWLESWFALEFWSLIKSMMSTSVPIRLFLLMEDVNTVWIDTAMSCAFAVLPTEVPNEKSVTIILSIWNNACFVRGSFVSPFSQSLQEKFQYCTDEVLIGIAEAQLSHHHKS